MKRINAHLNLKLMIILKNCSFKKIIVKINYNIKINKILIQIKDQNLKIYLKKYTAKKMMKNLRVVMIN